jgi:hypothetical protein
MVSVWDEYTTGREFESHRGKLNFIYKKNISNIFSLISGAVERSMFMLKREKDIEKNKI